jgi:CubicO group peptidase (beta-lactamase class C family)
MFFCPNRRAFYALLLLVVTVCSAANLIAAPPKFDPDKLAAVRTAMQKFVDNHELCGAVTVIGTSQGVVAVEAVGKQRLESEKPMAPDALFRIASMTKPITAIGIMILADEGKLSPDDPVEKYLPEFKGQMLVESRDGVPNNPQPTAPGTPADPAQAPAPRTPPADPATLSAEL